MDVIDIPFRIQLTQYLGARKHKANYHWHKLIWSLISIDRPSCRGVLHTVTICNNCFHLQNTLSESVDKGDHADKLFCLGQWEHKKTNLSWTQTNWREQWSIRLACGQAHSIKLNKLKCKHSCLVILFSIELGAVNVIGWMSGFLLWMAYINSHCVEPLRASTRHKPTWLRNNVIIINTYSCPLLLQLGINELQSKTILETKHKNFYKMLAVMLGG